MDSNNLIIISVCTMFLFGSCTKNKKSEEKSTLASKLISISDNEDKGIKEVLNFYGGDCTYSKGIIADTDLNKLNFFEITFANSDAINKFEKIPLLPSSNIAYRFYKNIKDQKQKYDIIRVTFDLNINNHKKKITNDYPINQLAYVDKKMHLIYDAATIVENQNFDKLKQMLNDKSVLKYDKDSLISNLIKLEDTLGQFKTFELLGLEVRTLTNLKYILHISGVIYREKQNHYFSVDVDPNVSQDELLFLQYEL